MEKTINIKFDEKQLEEISKRVIENIMKETEDNFYKLSNTGREKPKEKLTVMYLEVKTSGYHSEGQKVYFGNAFNTLSKGHATSFDLSILVDLKRVEELKSQGWKEEVVYK